MRTGRLRIGQVARATGLSTKTLRFYESLGLLDPARGENRYRLYDDAVMDRLRFVRRAQAVGLSLGEIGEILAIRDGGRAPCRHIASLVNRRLAETEAQLERLMELRDELARISDKLERATSAEPVKGVVCGCLEKAGAAGCLEPGEAKTRRRSAPRMRLPEGGFA